MNIPVVIGTTANEGTVFVFSAFPGRMAKLVYQTCVLGLFHTSAPAVLRRYAPLARHIEESLQPDYRLVLSELLGDYLFRCPNSHFASQLADSGIILSTIVLYNIV